MSKARKTAWSKRSDKLFKLAVSEHDRVQSRSAPDESPGPACTEYPDWFDDVVDATNQPVAVKNPRLSHSIEDNARPSSILPGRSAQKGLMEVEHHAPCTAFNNAKLFYGKSKKPCANKVQQSAQFISTEAVCTTPNSFERAEASLSCTVTLDKNNEHLSGKSEPLLSYQKSETDSCTTSPLQIIAMVPIGLEKATLSSKTSNMDSQCLSKTSGPTTVQDVCIRSPIFPSVSDIQISSISDHPSLVKGHTSSLGISPDFSSPGTPVANSTTILFTPNDPSPCNSSTGNSITNTPPARRRLFNFDEVDSWPIIIANEDGTAMELSSDLTDNNNELVANQEHNNYISPEGSLSLLESGEANNSLHVDSGSSGSSGKRHRKNQVINTPAARKRTRIPSQWIVNKRKEAKNAGESYTNSKGKLVPAKVMGPSCGKCKLQCYKRVTEEDRAEVFKKFYEEKTPKGKWDFISRLVQSLPTSTHSEKPVSGNNRDCARKYFFLVNKMLVRVCRTLFLTTLCISESTITTVFTKLDKSCKISPDKRGGHKNRPYKISDAVRDSVLSHINSFPRVASHLCRSSTNFDYLEPEVQSVANMYRLYRKWCPLNSVEKVATQRQYLDIFNNTPGLKISFFKPKKDQCNICFAFEHLSPEEKEPKRAEHEVHLKLKAIPRDMKDRDRAVASKSSDFCSAVFDLQKVLFTPVCEAGSLFYKRKLSNYNFSVYDTGNHECVCYCWNETLGKRGANEIASFLMDFLLAKVAKGFKKFHLYSDNCAGQNKNRMVYCMLMHIAAKCKVEIVLRFLWVGHTQNEGDHVHALIERSANRLEMFVPEDWWSHIENAKKTGKPYIVKRVTQEEIYNFHSFVHERCYWDKNTDGGTPQWSKMQELSFNGTVENPWIIQYRYDLLDETKFSINTKVATRGHPINLETHKFPKAYHHPLPISVAKLKDLLELCKEPHPTIPAAKAAFYKTLKSSKDVRGDEFYH